MIVEIGARSEEASVERRGRFGSRKPTVGFRFISPKSCRQNKCFTSSSVTKSTHTPPRKRLLCGASITILKEVPFGFANDCPRLLSLGRQLQPRSAII
ncbi:hypothetical protein CO667_10725 [Rhizobium sp. L43]|nr:hypothetical protein CO667_10725 [Rhizobium sp. L43]